MLIVLQRVVQKQSVQYILMPEGCYPIIINGITFSNVCYQLFIDRGFEWGGAWTSLKDYQHFEKWYESFVDGFRIYLD